MGLDMQSRAVSDIMSKTVSTVYPGETVAKTVEKMANLNIGAIVIVDEDERVVGIFTERDLLKKVCGRGKDLEDTLIEEVMTSDPDTLKPDTAISEAFMLMQNGKYRHVPVTEKGLLKGIVSIKDVNTIFQKIIGEMLFGA